MGGLLGRGACGGRFEVVARKLEHIVRERIGGRDYRGGNLEGCEATEKEVVATLLGTTMSYEVVSLVTVG